MSEYQRAWALIDASALRHNVTYIRSLVDDARVYAVVKANAYGHTLEHIVPTIDGLVDGFAVATLDEGIQLRSLNGQLPVIVLSELNSSSQLKKFIKYNLQPVVHKEIQLQWITDSISVPGIVWLKVDSGMHRLGIAPEDTDRLFRQLADAGNTVCLMSHMASADEITNNQNVEQIERFASLSLGYKTTRSLANSAALVAHPPSRLDLVRPGLLLYGVSPFDQQTDNLPLRAVMQLEARLIAIKPVQPGDKVGYGGTCTINRRGRIGVVGFGYADGYPRSVSTDAYVLVNGQKAPLAGRVSMDMLTIDLSDCEDVKEGDMVQLWGSGLSVARVAEWANTIPYELLCRVSTRVPRLLVDQH